MASRKRNPDSNQAGLSFAGLGLPSPESRVAGQVTQEYVSAGTPLRPEIETADLGLDDLDDYDDHTEVEGVPRLRLADPPREAPTVIVEAVGDSFEVSRLRDNGTTVACVTWTRKELEELARRITAALEM